MRITLDTVTDTYEEAAATVMAAYQVTDEAPACQEPADPASTDSRFLVGHYTEKRLRRFARNLAPDAAEAVRWIAENGPAAPIDELIHYMGEWTGIPEFGGQHLGGRLASVGFAVNSIPGVNEAPYAFDRYARVYRMEGPVAAILLDELGATG